MNRALPYEFDIYRRVVFKALDGVQLQQTQAGVAFDYVEIGFLFLVELGGIESGGAVLYAGAKLALAIHSSRAEVIEKFIEGGAVVFVVAGARCRGRRKSEGAVDEILSEFFGILRDWRGGWAQPVKSSASEADSVKRRGRRMRSTIRDGTLMFVRRAAVWVALSLLTLGSIRVQTAGQTIPAKEYQERRAELRRSLDGVMVLLGAADPVDLHESFFQEPNFAYLTGWHEPGAALLLTPKDEILFLPRRVANRETYNGRTTGPEEANAAQKAGFERVLPRAALETRFLSSMEASPVIYTLPGDSQARELARLAPLHEMRDAGQLIARLRLKKSPSEIAFIRKATEATIAAHRAAWKRMKPGLAEYQIAATVVGTYLELGCERSAYTPMIASGPNSVVLHYSANRRRIEAGDLVVMDAGGEYGGYATDVTRTIPATGKFTPRQREIYDIVLAAQKAAIAAVKPGHEPSGRQFHEPAQDRAGLHRHAREGPAWRIAGQILCAWAGTFCGAGSPRPGQLRSTAGARHGDYD